MLYPEMFAEVLPVHERFTECTGAGVPVPVSASVVGELVALLVKLNVAVTVTAAVGVKFTVKGTLFPAAIVMGRDKPLMVKTELFVLAPVTVTLAPLALRLPDAVPLSPTTTLPKESVDGFTESCPWLTATPVPVSDSVVVPGVALLVKLSFAFAVPVADGLNFTVKGMLLPAAMVVGRVRPLTVNTALSVLAAVTVTLAPDALKLPDAVPLLPTVMLPRLSVVGFTLSCPA
jgi:hypothetical protein